MFRSLCAGCELFASATTCMADRPREFVPNANSTVVSTADESISVEDGDSFWLGAFRIRLDGVDSLEPGQNCTLASGQKCTDAARNFLVEIMARSKITCTFVLTKDGRPKLSFNRYVSQCSKGGPEDEINRLMLSSGMAFAPESGADKEYETIVAVARADQRGVHSVGDVQHPAAYRRSIRARAPMSDVELISEVGKRWGNLSRILKEALRRLSTSGAA